MNTMTRLLLLVAPLALMAACGGGGDTLAGIDRGGIRGVSVGPVTGFGSIWLNGERYNVDDATITVDGQPASQDELNVGQVVVLTSNIDNSSGTRIADTVSYSSNLEGPASAVDITLGTFTLLGQTVFVNSNTVWGPGITPADLTGIAPGDLLEVSGLIDSQQRLLATRIDRENTLAKFILSGNVANLQTSDSTFTINGQLVDFSEATIDGFQGGEPQNGDFVRVRTTPVNQATLSATSLNKSGNLVDVANEDEGDIEGLITNFVDPTNFSVSGIPVRTTADTQYSNGNRASLALNVRIEAEGGFDASGILLASEIRFRNEGDAEIEALVDATLAAESRVIVCGVSVEINSLTLIEDNSGQALRPFTISDIQPGDFLKITGYENTGSGATVVATKLERTDGEDSQKIRGVASNAVPPGFDLLGVTALTDNQTEFSADDATITAEAFFSSADGRSVDAAGICQGDTFQASEVELDD